MNILGRIAAAAAFLVPAFGANAATMPERVTFPGADGRTVLTGYLYVPAHRPGTRSPAVVMMHGRAGAYSTSAEGRYEAATLSQRHKAWGESGPRTAMWRCWSMVSAHAAIHRASRASVMRRGRPRSTK